MVDIKYIRKKHFLEGWSIRKINRNLGVARQTVRKFLESSEIPKYKLSKEKKCPVMEPFKDIGNGLRKTNLLLLNNVIRQSGFMRDYAKNIIFLEVSLLYAGMSEC